MGVKSSPIIESHLRWLKVRILEKYYKDLRDRRLFREEGLNKIRTKVRMIEVEDSYYGGRNGKGSYN
jgi:hypothetical protein